jgi:hypothetical protein
MNGRASLRAVPGGLAGANGGGRRPPGIARGGPRAGSAFVARPSDGRPRPEASPGTRHGVESYAVAGVQTLAGARPRGLVATALAAAGSWLLEPAEPATESHPSAPAGPRRVIAVFGLARGCGVTVVSRALAAELASRDVEGAAAVHCDARAAGIPLATQPANHLARALADVPGANTRAVGRLCLVGGAEHRALADTARHLAPLVLDSGSTSLGGVPAALADNVIVVAGPSTEPALLSVAADCLARLGHEPIAVLNRAPPDPPTVEAVENPAAGAGAPSGTATGGMDREGQQTNASLQRALRLPESRMGAQLALGGREPRGELGRAIAELADLCEGPG